MVINVEKAKSYFVLSQILIILAGFLFASSGVVYALMFNSFDKAVELALSNSTNSSFNVTGLIQTYGDLAVVNFSLYKYFLYSGAIVTFFSLLAWCLGNSKIKLGE